MSAQYTAEPPTEGSITMETTHGPLHIKLWPKDATAATRLFVQNVIDGFYDALPFHRIVPDLLVQSGDRTDVPPMSPVSAAPSAEPAPRARNARLKFRRRGLVALVAHDHAHHTHPPSSQFFITLQEAQFLNARHPIVGTVVGNCIFNLINIAAYGPVDGVRPDDLPRVLRCSVVENPFPDLVAGARASPLLSPRASLPVSARVPPAPRAARHALPPRATAGRTDRVLSFRPGEEDDDDDDDDDDKDKLNARHARASRNPFLPRRKPMRRATMFAASPSERAASPPPPAALAEPTASVAEPTSSPPHATSAADKSAFIQSANARFEQVKRQLLGTQRALQAGRAVPQAVLPPVADVTEVDAKRDVGADPDSRLTGRKRRRGQKEGEKEVLQRLEAFESKLMQARKKPDQRTEVPLGRPKECHPAWFVHGLRLRPPSDDEREYDVIDNSEKRQQ